MQPKAPSPENITQVPADRDAARSAMRRDGIAARLALPAALHAAHTARIEAALETLLAVLPAPTFAFCWPVRMEFDARPLAERLLARGGRACLPVVTADAAPLEFRTWTPASTLAPDRYGIPTPVSGEFIVPELVLIPLVAFDARNFRIGYGGGFFDRTLAALSPRPLAIGVGFEVARVADTLPGRHDIALDIVVTEAGSQRAPQPA